MSYIDIYLQLQKYTENVSVQGLRYIQLTGNVIVYHVLRPIKEREGKKSMYNFLFLSIIAFIPLDHVFLEREIYVISLHDS